MNANFMMNQGPTPSPSQKIPQNIPVMANSRSNSNKNQGQKMEFTRQFVPLNQGNEVKYEDTMSEKGSKKNFPVNSSTSQSGRSKPNPTINFQQDIPSKINLIDMNDLLPKKGVKVFVFPPDNFRNIKFTTIEQVRSYLTKESEKIDPENIGTRMYS